VVVERHVKASPETVFKYFTDRERWLQWQGVTAELEPHPGGRFRMDVRGDGHASGRFLEVTPRRIVFTWGWEMEGNAVPPGSSTVEVDLLPEEDGTLVRLTHRNLPPAAFEVHHAGWEHYLDRLATRVAGGDPGPDPLRVAEGG
jgi:uncharacterized protein YndB with AHSA1/START domain